MTEALSCVGTANTRRVACAVVETPVPEPVTVRLNEPLDVGVPVTGHVIEPTMRIRPLGGAGSEATGTGGEHAPTVAQAGRPDTVQLALAMSSVPAL